MEDRFQAGTPFSTRVEASGLDLLTSPVPDESVIDAQIDLRDAPPAQPAASKEWYRSMAGRVAVVTGAHEPVGAAVALGLVDAGAHVCIIGRDGGALAALATSAGRDASVVSLQCDLGSAADIASAADFVARVDRPLDVLVHCADVRVSNGVSFGAVEDLDEQYLVNLRGPYLLTQALVGPLSEAAGHVVFVGPSGEPGDRAEDTQYSMTRFGVRALAAGVRAELSQAGLRVTTVHVAPAPVGVEAALDPDDVADCVIGALEIPARLEITDLHLRPRATR